MWSNKKSVILSIGVCAVVSVALLTLVFFGPQLFLAYMTVFRGIAPDSIRLQTLETVFISAFYPSAVFAAAILYALFRLLFNIHRGEVFILQNANMLKLISYGCYAIAAITFVAGFFYMPFLFITAAGGFVGILLRVLKNVMQAAIELREESDLTI